MQQAHTRTLPTRSDYPQELTDRPQWLVWRYVNKTPGKKPSKMPYYVNGQPRGWPNGRPHDGKATESQPQHQQGAMEDRAELVDFDAALIAAHAGRYDGVGFAFLPGDGLIGIDLDKVVGYDDDRDDLGRSLIEGCQTFAELSPSRTGLHIIGRGTLRTFKSNDVGIEVFCGSQFFTMPGEHHPDSPFEIGDIPPAVLARLLALVDAAKEARKAATPSPVAPPVAARSPAGGGNRYAEAAFTSAVQAVRSQSEGGRNDTLNKEAFGLGQLVGGGYLSEHEVHAALTEAGLACGLGASEVASSLRSGLEAGKRSPRVIARSAAPVARPAAVVDDAPDWVDAETGEIHEAGRVAPPDEMPRALLMSVDEMLADCVWVAQGEQVAMMSRPGAVWSWSEFRNLTAASKTTVEPEEGEKKKPRPIPNAVIWHNSPARITVDSRTFRPGAGPITARPGVDPAAGLLAVNSWRPIRRGRGGADISLFLDHLAYLFPDAVERNAFFDWLAHLEQRPGELPHYGWLHIAEKTGTGRNWLSSLLGRIWAGYVASSVDLPALLDSQFNGQLAGRVLAVVDEIREGGGESVYKHANRLKSLINQETREINPKYGRQYTEYNALRWLVYSNHLEAIPMDETDRRWRVAMHTAAPRPEAAYSALYAALDDPAFVDSVAVWLGARDISGFNPGARPPMTAAKQTAIHATMSAAQQYAREIVARWPSDVITSADAAEILADHADGDPRKPAMVPHFRRSMEEAGAVAVGKVIKVGGNPHRCWVIRNHGQWVGALPGVIASEALRARSGRGTHSTARFVLVDSPAL